jgi:hypothetical protein
VIWAFGLTYDHVRVLYQPRIGHDSLQLVGKPPSWVVPYKILWRDYDPLGLEGTIKAISISTNDDRICGMRFEYTTGYSRGLGSQSGTTSKFEIEDGRDIQHVVVGDRLHRGMGLLKVSSHPWYVNLPALQSLTIP